jgi:CHASE2 domain-containing sensor protein
MGSQLDNGSDRPIVKSLLAGLIITFLILGIKWWFEDASLYQNLQRACYSWLQARLSTPSRREDLPVVIVDISDLEYTTTEVEGKRFTVTPRDHLWKLIEAIAAQGPKVIGVDIDFSPNQFGYVDPLVDPGFFRDISALSKQKGIPIFLGIKRSQARSADMWLGNKEFADLAANIFISDDDNRKMLKWVLPSGSDTTSRSANERPGLAMCAVLAGPFKSVDNRFHKRLTWAIEQSSEVQPAPDLTGEEFLVDFSPIEALKVTRLKTTNAAVIKDQGWLLANRAVLIGDGTPGENRDAFIVPQQDQKQPVPGVYLHASAAYTLIKAPLYEFTAVGRLGMDFLLSVIVLISVTFARLYVTNRTKVPARKKVPARTNDRFAQWRATYLFILTVTLISITIGIVFVHKTRVIWDDFLFVLLALWLHPVFERTVVNGLSAVKDNAPLVLMRLFSEKDG